jgi:hypothetical protein
LFGDKNKLVFIFVKNSCGINFAFSKIYTPPAGIEPASHKGPVLKTGAIPLCDGGLNYRLINRF